MKKSFWVLSFLTLLIFLTSCTSLGDAKSFGQQIYYGTYYDINSNLLIPNQTGQAGKVLGTNGTNTLWQTGGGSGITSVDTGTPSNITGIVTGNGSVLGSITDNSAAWNTALQSAGTAPGTYNNVTVATSGLVTSGSNVAYLTSVSATPGTYNNVTVNSSGLVTSGSDASYITFGSLSASNPITYNNSTGAIGWTNSNNYITLGSLSGTSPIGYDSSTGVISFSNPGYITGNQSISLGGILSGSGTTSITASAATGYYMPTTTDESNWNAKLSSVSGSNLDNVWSSNGILTRTGAATYSTITDNSSTWNTALQSAGTSAGTYNNVTVATSGLVTSGSNVSYQSPLTFSDSLSNTGGTVTLVNDAASPSASYYYGTNSGGTLGYFALPATGMTNPMTTLGDIIYENSTPAADRLAGDISNSNKFLRSLSVAGVAQVPSWQSVTKTDVGLSAVENTALSTWAGTSNITTLGTVTTGTLSGITLQGTISAGTGLTMPTFTMADSADIVLNTSHGTEIGTGATQKLGFYGATPVVQQTGNLITALSNLGLVTSGTLTSADVGLGSVENTALSTWAGTTNITTLGTITTGTWDGGLITGTYGGTGVNNGASTVTIGGNVTFSGAYTFTGALSNNTSVTFPTSGTLVSSVTTGNGVSATNTAGALAFTLGAITPSTVNGLTLAQQANQFTIQGGTGTAKTLTVTGNATISGTPLSNPMTTLGDIIYENSTPAPAALAGDTSNTDKFLRSLSIAGVAQAPSWQSVTQADVGLSAAWSVNDISRSSSTPAIVTGCTLALAANSKYLIEIHGFATTVASGSCNIQLHYESTGLTVYYSMIGIPNNSTVYTYKTALDSDMQVAYNNTAVVPFELAIFATTGSNASNFDLYYDSDGATHQATIKAWTSMQMSKIS